MVDLEKDFIDLEDTAVRWSRAVVAKRLAIVAVVTVVLNVVVSRGWITPDLSKQALDWTTQALNAVAFIAAAKWIKGAVTPAADPRTDIGEKLVPASEVKTVVVNTAAPVTASSAAAVENPPLVPEEDRQPDPEAPELVASDSEVSTDEAAEVASPAPTVTVAPVTEEK